MKAAPAAQTILDAINVVRQINATGSRKVPEDVSTSFVKTRWKPLVITDHPPDSGKAIFELNEGGHYDHLICLTCGRVDEFQDEVIESRKQDVATINGYQLTMHRLALYGICPHCSAASIKSVTA